MWAEGFLNSKLQLSNLAVSEKTWFSKRQVGSLRQYASQSEQFLTQENLTVENL